MRIRFREPPFVRRNVVEQLAGVNDMAAIMSVAYASAGRFPGELQTTASSSQLSESLYSCCKGALLKCKLHSWTFKSMPIHSQGPSSLPKSISVWESARHSLLASSPLQPVARNLEKRFLRSNAMCSFAGYCCDDHQYNSRTRNSSNLEAPRRTTELLEETSAVEEFGGRRALLDNVCNSASANRSTCSKSVHPTAVVHPDAIIAEDVIIGPFCTVGAGVKVERGCILHPSSHIHGNTELGERCIIHTGAVVGADIPGCTVLGMENTIGNYAVVGVKCQDLKYKEGDECSLYIGNNNEIREYASIHRSSKSSSQTIIGNQNLIMGSCHIAHDCKIGSHNIFANGTLLGGHVIVQDHVHTGGAVAIHQFCFMDSYSFVAGGSMVARDVPMYMMVAGDRAELRGLNLEGLRRNGFSNEEVRSIRRAYQILFMSTDPDAGGLEDKIAVLESSEEMMNVPAVVLMVQSIRDCFGEHRRGICSFRHWSCA